MIAMKHHLYTCEMMDDTILNCTKTNREQAKNRFFIQGEPKAIIMLEVAADTIEDAERQAEALIDDLNKTTLAMLYLNYMAKTLIKLMLYEKLV